MFKDNLGFSTYRTGGNAFGNEGVTGFFTIVSTAFFAFNGTELVGVTAGEAENPKKSIPAAIKSTFWRITIFYTVTIFIIGLIVPQNHPALGLGELSASPFVLTMEKLHAAWATDALNAVIFVAVLSAGNSCVYATSRILMGLAEANHAPKIFLENTANGVPMYPLILSTLIGALSYISIIPGCEDMLRKLMSLTGMQVMLTYTGICLVHLRFRQAFFKQGFSLSNLPYVAPYAPFSQILGVSMIGILLLGMMFSDLRRPTMTLSTFIQTYSGLPVYLAFYLGYKFYKKTSFIPLMQVEFDGKVGKDIELDTRKMSDMEKN